MLSFPRAWKLGHTVLREWNRFLFCLYRMVRARLFFYRGENVMRKGKMYVALAAAVMLTISGGGNA